MMDPDQGFNKSCVGCGYVITSKYLSLNGEDWHAYCVLCDECEGPIFDGESASKYHTQDGKIYCKECVTQLFQVCVDCGQPAKKYVKALGQIWHTFHFKCASCKTILDSYAEVEGQAFCLPCHQRMSARDFTRAKRRSFGTEKREQANKAAANRPAWAQKPKASLAPKSALDVMHKSWFQSGLTKKSTSPTPPSPSSSPTPSSPRANSGSPTLGRPQSPAPFTLSPNMSKPTAPANAKPPGSSFLPGRINSPTQPPAASQQRPAWMKSAPEPEKPKTPWTPPASKQAAPAPAPFGRSNLKAAPASPQFGSPQFGSPQFGSSQYGSPQNSSHYGASRATSPNGYTNISFQPHSPAQPKGAAKHAASQQEQNVPAGSVNLSDILEAIFRPMTEEEIGSLASQALPLLGEVHKQGKLHSNLKHKTIFITPSGVVTFTDHDAEDDSKVGGASIKFKAPESDATVASDVYSLGVALWTSADYLLDEEEEPALSADFCEFIGGMTEDEPENRPPLSSLIPYLQKYKELSTNYLAALIKEVERKKLLRKNIVEDKERKQRQLGKVLMDEIDKGVRLRKVDPATLVPAQRQSNPQEMLCMMIKTFSMGKLKKIDPTKLPPKQFKMNPRERLMQAVLSRTHLRRALVVGGLDINQLIVPVPNHPTYGTIFRDVSALFTVPKVSSAIAQQICTRFTGDPPDLFVATPTDAGVYFASLVAEFFNRGVIVLQNAGRLPRKMEKYSCGYETLGYVSHSLELQLQKNLVKEGTRVVLIDEMLVNGSILEAARIILRETGAKIKEVLCIAELEGFGGRLKIRSFECNVHAMYTFNDNQTDAHR